MSADELPSWRETTAKQSIVEFVAAVTDPDSPDFIPGGTASPCSTMTARCRLSVLGSGGSWWVFGWPGC